MNIKQAKKKVEAAKNDLKEKTRKLEDDYALVAARNDFSISAARIALFKAEVSLDQAIANENKGIKMYHFIGSGLMMEFYDHFHDVQYGYLKEIKKGMIKSYINQRGDGFKHCQPIFNDSYASITGWVKPPIPEGYVIHYADFGEYWIVSTDDYSTLDWDKIRIFRIMSVRDDYKGRV
ncbi:MAG: hypothetical protein GY810_32345 [Aureispira sp.]|nr:hypothetical protein [Aureispira sp.]